MAEIGTVYSGMRYVKFWKTGFQPEGLSFIGFDDLNVRPRTDEERIEVIHRYMNSELRNRLDDGAPYPGIKQFKIDNASPVTNTIKVNIMNTENLNAACLFQEDMTTVKVAFDTQDFYACVTNSDYASYGKVAPVYVYKVKRDWKISVGDFLVVPEQNSLKVVRVVAVDDEPDINYYVDFKYQWAISRVQFTDFVTINESEKKFYETLKNSEKNRIKKQIIEELNSQCDSIESAVKFLK
jgi:hypothetical protein